MWVGSSTAPIVGWSAGAVAVGTSGGAPTSAVIGITSVDARDRWLKPPPFGSGVAAVAGLETGFDSTSGSGSGFDSAFETGFDSTFDSGSGFDSAFETGFDSTFDSGFETGFDSTFGSGFETGFDSTFDSELDAGTVELAFDASFGSGLESGFDSTFDSALESAFTPAFGSAFEPAFGLAFGSAFDSAAGAPALPLPFAIPGSGAELTFDLSSDVVTSWPPSSSISGSVFIRRAYASGPGRSIFELAGMGFVATGRVDGFEIVGGDFRLFRLMVIGCSSVRVCGQL